MTARLWSRAPGTTRLSETTFLEGAVMWIAVATAATQ